MKLLLHLAAISLLIPLATSGVKHMMEHFTGEPEALLLHGSHRNNTQTVDALPLEFHKENTVTNDLMAEEEEEEDYLDLDKILGESDDYSDIIDATPEGLDSDTKRGNILELFSGKSRIQRLNILNADFGFNLYRSLKDTTSASENILVSPVAISISMATMSLGLRGKTLQEVMLVSGFEDFVNASSQYDIMTIHNLFRKLTHRLFRRNFGYTLRSVNDLYMQDHFSIHPTFTNKIKEFYFAEIQSVDFSDPAFISRANQRILKLSKGLIKEALVHVQPALLMLILNCVYFKGTWEIKFPVEQTENLNFRLNERQVVKVPMMKTKGNFLVTADHELDCGVLQLPYIGNISMLIVMPHTLSGMKLLEKQLTPQVVERWQSIMANRTREVFLPRFRLEKNYDMTQVLTSMGIKDLFNFGNFSGISDKSINVGLFKHQGTITVNEEGTEAAAVTTVGFMPLSIQARFVADRPFLFLIYEHRTKCLLFMGRVADPTKF
ncbi:heparin cofactor 2 [Microcaecilia unicolor]|uniref:Heparin cofactor 2 n=1 Tax=Microcaecilia unicolor TaxID=1415580 RepID=A0A6P7ZGH1_9AMPH|nr:heparin cofactor 2 [Microcaecilia unicolor]XP_030075460.1 heparin cofactor 2 [Microcaecilia unicolor]XP_030075461.1 heparin cofactor 2 [Microcaecilia unicolor]